MSWGERSRIRELELRNEALCKSLHRIITVCNRYVDMQFVTQIAENALNEDKKASQ